MEKDEIDVTRYAEERCIGFVQYLINNNKLETSPSAIVKTISKIKIKHLYLQYLANYYVKLLKNG